MKTIITIVAIFLTVNLLAQNQLSLHSSKYMQKVLNSTEVGGIELIKDYVYYNFSKIWKKQDKAILGYIGNNYQRFDIKFLSIIKNVDSPSKYYIYGKSRVKNNLCDFQGELEIIHIRLLGERERLEFYNEAMKHGDKDAAEAHKYKRFILLARYTFHEDINKKGTGLFSGVLKSNFYIDGDDIKYDDLEKGRKDDFRNNQFVGIWQSYKTKVSKKCNWGEYRIPNSSDLDIGAGEFSPNRRYISYGWDVYIKAYLDSNSEALKEEKKLWWK